MPKGLKGFQVGNIYGGTDKIINSPNFSGDKNPFYGKHHTKKTKKKISELMKGKMSGNKHPRWKGGITSKYWASMVKKRDNWICQKCGFSDSRIVQADHIKSKKLFPKLKSDINNGMTLCPNCHAIKTYEDKLLRKLKNQRQKESAFNCRMD